MLYHEDGSIKGIATNDVGIHKDGSPKVLNYFDLSTIDNCYILNTFLLAVWPFCVRLNVNGIILLVEEDKENDSEYFTVIYFWSKKRWKTVFVWTCLLHFFHSPHLSEAWNSTLKWQYLVKDATAILLRTCTRNLTCGKTVIHKHTLLDWKR